MDLLTTIRPDEWNFPLFLHIVGAMGFVVGALSTAAYYLFRARRDGSAALTRVGFRTLLYAGIPSYLVGRLSAQWLLDKEGLGEPRTPGSTSASSSPTSGSCCCSPRPSRPAIAARRAEGSVGSGPAIAAWCCSVLLVAYTVALWAMATKPV